MTPYPNIFICGKSGSGKSSSLENLPSQRTIVLNAERKTLPFRGANKFDAQPFLDDWSEFATHLNAAMRSQTRDIIVIDSFTSAIEKLHNAAVRGERDGFDGWDRYRNCITDMMAAIKHPTKYVIMIGIEDLVQDELNRMHRTIGVQGQWKGKIEKEFEIVLWSRIVDGHYKFMTQSDGQNSAKSPRGMFDSQFIDNDIDAVLRSVSAYYATTN